MGLQLLQLSGCLVEVIHQLCQLSEFRLEVADPLLVFLCLLLTYLDDVLVLLLTPALGLGSGTARFFVFRTLELINFIKFALEKENLLRHSLCHFEVACEKVSRDL